MSTKDVLYIAQDRNDNSIFDRGSRVCMGILNVSPIDVLVQNVNVLQEKKVNLPEWLIGTPSFVDIEAKQVYRGSHAIQRIREKAARSDEQKDTPLPHIENTVHGMTAPGQRFVTGDNMNDNMDDSLTDIPTAQSAGGAVREGSVTESELQAYMQQREAAMPKNSGSQQQI